MSALDDPHLDNLEIAQFGRWCKLGAFVKKHGTDGKITLSPPCRALVAKMQVACFNDMIVCFEEMPNITVSGETSKVVSFNNWLKYQGDFSTERVRQFRIRKRSKRRGEERRREETRREERKEEEVSAEPKTDLGSAAPSNGLPDWFKSVLKDSPNFSALLEAKHAAFWKEMSKTFDPYQWLSWDEEIHKADAWITCNPQKKPRQLRRFLLNWFNTAVNIGRIQRAKEERARAASDRR